MKGPIFIFSLLFVISSCQIEIESGSTIVYQPSGDLVTSSLVSSFYKPSSSKRYMGNGRIVSASFTDNNDSGYYQIQNGFSFSPSQITDETLYLIQQLVSQDGSFSVSIVLSRNGWNQSPSPNGLWEFRVWVQTLNNEFFLSPSWPSISGDSSYTSSISMNATSHEMKLSFVSNSIVNAQHVSLRIVGSPPMTVRRLSLEAYNVNSCDKYFNIVQSNLADADKYVVENTDACMSVEKTNPTTLKFAKK
eukprot:TRINITY_DN5530_c0_g1_i2.p1 TRINITY_DN5530_c0_g1~~TRINITY_DN5530_c0_g1_i2.p1  ORF type:complete len:248 (-),score=43.66 TRINITY_DN5530_c0_g1_i2:638-1381(-)